MTPELTGFIAASVWFAPMMLLTIDALMSWSGDEFGDWKFGPTYRRRRRTRILKVAGFYLGIGLIPYIIFAMIVFT